MKQSVPFVPGWAGRDEPRARDTKQLKRPAKTRIIISQITRKTVHPELGKCLVYEMARFWSGSLQSIPVAIENRYGIYERK